MQRNLAAVPSISVAPASAGEDAGGGSISLNKIKEPDGFCFRVNNNNNENMCAFVRVRALSASVARGMVHAGGRPPLAGPPTARSVHVAGPARIRHSHPLSPSQNNCTSRV